MGCLMSGGAPRDALADRDDGAEWTRPLIAPGGLAAIHTMRDDRDA